MRKSTLPHARVFQTLALEKEDGLVEVLALRKAVLF